MTETEVNPQETANIAVETPPPQAETVTPTQEKVTPPIETVEPAKETVAPKKEKPLSDWKRRYAITKNFAGARGEMVKAVIEEGIKQGYWESVSHFMDKAIDFAINSQLVHSHLNITDAYIFGVPDSVQTKLFTNGFYKNDSQLKLEKC